MKYWTKPPSLMFVLWLALFVLLPVLAYWQYHWLGEVSEAERERRQRTLKHSAAQFGHEFDQEVTLAYVSLQDPSGPFSQPEPFAERYRRWHAAAAHPRLVRAVYQAEADERGAYLFKRFNPATGGFEPAGETAVQELERLQACFAGKQTAHKRVHQVLQNMIGPHLSAEGSAKNELREMNIEVRRKNETKATTFIQVNSNDALDEHLPGLVLPLASFPHNPHELLESLVARRYRVVLFDQDYLRQELFPELLRKHLQNLGLDEYHCAVLSADKANPAVLYQSAAQLPASMFATSDVAEPFFKLRLEGRDRLMLRQFGNLPPRVPSATEERKSIAVGVITNDVRVQSKTGEALLPSHLDALLKRTGEGAWQVVLKHRAGSLEAAVAKVRRRNLAISFGVLALLGGSVGLIVLSSRRAQALAAKQMEFVAGISHELRTPLAVICSAAENLADGVVDNREQTKRYGTLIRDEGRRLTSMVEQVLEFAGAQSGRKTYELRPLQPEQVIEDALTALHLPLEEQGFTVEKQLAAELPLIQADDAALSRALQNLLSNAMKYSGESRWLGLRASVAKTAPGEELRIAVTDRGLGIAPAELPHIFDPFYRGKEVRAAQIHGNGLGLSLVKHIVEAHGGRVSVESKVGQGSTFTLHLPVVREAAVLTPLLVSKYEQAPSAR